MEKHPKLGGKYMIEYNRHIFDIIDISEKAYWLGFIIADGYLNDNKNMLRIKLGNKDKKHLEKFINFLEGDLSMLKSEIHSITGNTQWYVSTYAPQIHDALKNLKVEQAKSGKEKVPPIEEKFYRDFIRGLWDGDGFIRESLNGIGLVGSKEILSFVQDIFQKELQIKPLKIYDHYNIYKIEYRSTKKAIPLIINYLYQDMDVSLDRKMELASQIKKIC